MAVSLINNLGSLDAQSKLNVNGNKLNSTIQRLSSGLRINNSGDDAAGLAIANAYRSDISTLRQGVRNANDGQSTLQIVDGGLNTISGLLDRATTLASQSASGTFSGNRDTLQREFGSILGEITRQAQNIGLGGASGTAEGRFNKQLDVFIGGGTSASATNNTVSIDLSSSRVDATGLSLNGLNIGTGTGSVTGNRAITSLTADEVLTFRTVDSTGGLSSHNVTLSAGSSGANIVDALNADASLQSAGIKASIDSNNKLVFASSNFFAVSSDTADGAGQTGIAGAGAAANDMAITGAASKKQVNVAAATAAGSQTVTFTSDQLSSPVNQAFTTSTTAATGAANARNAVNGNQSLKAAGVFALVDKADGSSVTFVSLKSFNVSISNDAAAGANNNLTASSLSAASAGTTTGGVDGAKDALTAIKAAIESMGIIQGKVGAGQNTLTQAIDLASSQITNFQAAESRVRDADVAAEASNLSRLTTLQQAGVAALAQANQSSQAVLSLLR